VAIARALDMSQKRNEGKSMPTYSSAKLTNHWMQLTDMRHLTADSASCNEVELTQWPATSFL